MLRALLAMVAAGTTIGLVWPVGGDEPVQPVLALATEASETVIERERNGHFYVHAKVNGELVRFVVDTGATGVALTPSDAKRVGIAFSPEEFDYVGEGASGAVRGKIITLDEIEVDGKSVSNVSGAVLEGSTVSLLGQSYLSRIAEVNMRGDVMVLR